jgi:phosphoglycolate phosphatase-like HAD superfamily hydrolase
MTAECNRRALAALGLPPPTAEVLEMLNGPSPAEACALLGLPAERAGEVGAAMAWAEAELVPACARLFDGVPEMLADLGDRATLCLLTNGQTSYMEQVCQVTGIGPLFAERAGSEPGISKVARLRGWLARYAPHRALVVGDRPTDIAAARQVGATALGVIYAGGPPVPLDGADALAAGIAEVRRYCLRFCAED